LRKKTAFIVLGLSFLTIPMDQRLATILFAIGWVLLEPWIILREAVWGIRMNLPVKKGSTFYLLKRGKRFKYGTFIEITDVEHGSFDAVDEREFCLKSKLLLDGMIVDPDAEYALIYVKRNGILRVFLQVVVEGVDPQLLKTRVARILYILTRHLDAMGVRYSGPLVPDLPWISPASRKPWCIIPILAPAVKFIFNPPEFSLPDSTIVLLFLTGLYSLLSSYKGYRVEGRVVLVVENSSLYSTPSYMETLQKSQWFSRIMGVLDNFMLVARIKLAPPSLGETLEKRAFRLYERATAFDKLSLMAKAERLYTAARRRMLGRESTYLAKIVAIFESKSDSKTFSKMLEDLGFTVTVDPILKGFMEDVYYG